MGVASTLGHDWRINSYGRCSKTEIPKRENIWSVCTAATSNWWVRASHKFMETSGNSNTTNSKSIKLKRLQDQETENSNWSPNLKHSAVSIWGQWRCSCFSKPRKTENTHNPYMLNLHVKEHETPRTCNIANSRISVFLKLRGLHKSRKTAKSEFQDFPKIWKVKKSRFQGFQQSDWHNQQVQNLGM